MERKFRVERKTKVGIKAFDSEKKDDQVTNVRVMEFLSATNKYNRDKKALTKVSLTKDSADYIASYESYHPHFHHALTP